MATDEAAVPGVIGGGDNGVEGVKGHGDRGPGNSRELGVYAGEEMADRGDKAFPCRDVHLEKWRPKRLPDGDAGELGEDA